MKTKIQIAIATLIMALVMANPLQAQDRTQVTIKVTRDGEVVKDTTYQFESADQAEHMLNLMEILGSEGDKEFEYEYKMAYSGGDHQTTAVYVTKDGEKTEIKEISSDSLVWIMEGDDEGENIQVIRKGMVLPDTLQGAHMIITKSGDPDRKVVKVTVSEDGKGNWNIISEETDSEEEDIYIISADSEDLEAELEKIEELKGDNVKVVVVKKKKEENKDNLQ